MSDSDPWSGFSADPRTPEHANLRAADSDRERLTQIIGDAYAEGKLDQFEYDDRLSQAMAVRKLGEIPHLLEDLVVAEVPAAVQHRRDRQVKLDRRRRTLEKRRRNTIVGAVSGWAGLAGLLTTIWLLTALSSGGFYYFWPIWPMLGTAIPTVTTIFAALSISTDPEDDDA